MPKPSTARPAPKSPPEKPVPTSAPKKPPKYDGPPASRIRAVKTGHNEYSVLEETWSGPPTSTVVQVEKVDGTSAMYRARLWAEEKLGPNRLGGTGLE